MSNPSYELLLQRLEGLLNTNKITISGGKIQINNKTVDLPKPASNVVSKSTFSKR